jgi:hypothetical protein
MHASHLSYDADWTEGDYLYLNHALSVVREEWAAYTLLLDKMDAENPTEVRILDDARTRAFDATDDLVALFHETAAARAELKRTTI